jgi:hypothetical protein
MIKLQYMYIFLYFELFLAKMFFLVLKRLKIHYKRSEFFSQNRPLKVSKDPYFYTDLKNVNLRTKCTQKSYY